MKSKNKYQHNDDGTTHIFVESKNKYFPGKHTIIIDTEDWDRVKEYKWRIFAAACHRYPYAITDVPHPAGGTKACGRARRTALYLHHAVIGKPQRGMVADHINLHGLDNRKDNLREVTYAQNNQNMRSAKNSASKYKGVSWHSQHKKWQAAAGRRRSHTHIGYYACEHEAALAYNKKALELWGEHALLNNVDKA